MTNTIAELLAAGAAAGPAIGAPGRVPLTYQGLRDLTDRTGLALRGMGLGKDDCIAIE
jgi:hypothetical protein